MCCIVLDIELADKNVLKYLGVFIDGNVQGYSCRPPKKYKPTKQAFWCTRNMHGIVWNSGRLENSEFSNILPRAVKCEFFAKGTEKCKILGNQLDAEWNFWKTTAVLKFKISLKEKLGFARVPHSDTGPHFTVQSVRQNCLVTG